MTSLLTNNARFRGRGSPESAEARRQELWDIKWHQMIKKQQEKQRRQQQLKQKLDEQKQQEEERECTFKPGTCAFPTELKRNSKKYEESLRKLACNQQELYMELKELDLEDNHIDELIRNDLPRDLKKYTARQQQKDIADFYKEKRIVETCGIQNRRLEIITAMTKLENSYKKLVHESINASSKSIETYGFDPELTSKLKPQIMDQISSAYSLKNFAKATALLNEIEEFHEMKRLERNHQSASRKSNTYGTPAATGTRDSQMHYPSHFSGETSQYGRHTFHCNTDSRGENFALPHVRRMTPQQQENSAVPPRNPYGLTYSSNPERGQRATILPYDNRTYNYELSMVPPTTEANACTGSRYPCGSIGRPESQQQDHRMKNIRANNMRDPRINIKKNPLHAVSDTQQQYEHGNLRNLEADKKKPISRGKTVERSAGRAISNTKLHRYAGPYKNFRNIAHEMRDSDRGMQPDIVELYKGNWGNRSSDFYQEPTEACEAFNWDKRRPFEGPSYSSSYNSASGTCPPQYGATLRPASQSNHKITTPGQETKHQPFSCQEMQNYEFPHQMQNIYIPKKQQSSYSYQRGTKGDTYTASRLLADNGTDLATLNGVQSCTVNATDRASYARVIHKDGALEASKFGYGGGAGVEWSRTQYLQDRIIPIQVGKTSSSTTKTPSGLSYSSAHQQAACASTGMFPERMNAYDTREAPSPELFGKCPPQTTDNFVGQSFPVHSAVHYGKFALPQAQDFVTSLKPKPPQLPYASSQGDSVPQRAELVQESNKNEYPWALSFFNGFMGPLLANLQE